MQTRQRTRHYPPKDTDSSVSAMFSRPSFHAVCVCLRAKCSAEHQKSSNSDRAVIFNVSHASLHFWGQYLVTVSGHHRRFFLPPDWVLDCKPRLPSLDSSHIPPVCYLLYATRPYTPPVDEWTHSCEMLYGWHSITQAKVRIGGGATKWS